MAELKKRGDQVYQISVFLGRDTKGRRKFLYETFHGPKSLAQARARELETQRAGGR